MTGLSTPPLLTLSERAAALSDAFLSRLSDAPAPFPVEEFDALDEAGLLLAPLPEDEGGPGLGLMPGRHASLFRLLTLLGRGNLAVGRLFEGHVNALQLLHCFGSPQQFAQAAADVRERRCIFGVWNTQPSSGLHLTAGPGGLVLQGTKSFCSGAGSIHRAVVTAQTPEGEWQMLLLPLDRLPPAIDRESWRPLGMESTASFTVDFSGLIPDRTDLLGRSGDYYREPLFTAGGLRFVAVQLGGVEAILETCRALLQRSVRSREALELYRLGELAIEVESGRQWMARAGRLLDGGETRDDELIVFTRMARSAMLELGIRVIALAQRIAGARELIAPSPLPRLLRDLQLYLRQAAPDQAVMAVGEHVLTHDPRCARRSTL